MFKWIRLFILTFSIGFLAFCPKAFSQKLQILHTNDIHSYFDHTDQDPTRGGYDQLKSLIETQKFQAGKQNIPSLVVDAGDFLEGHLYYMADYGRKSFEMHNRMGYDIAVIGNHDYLMGTESLDNILRDVPPRFSFLGANVHVDKKYSHINEHLKPYKIVDVGSKKIGFLGVTTDEFFYTWRIKNGKISDPINMAKHYAWYLKNKQDCDFVVAVTHIGFNSDKRLASAVPDLDLIIGGHSHTLLRKVHYERSYRRNVGQRGNGFFTKDIPIVQVGKHAEYLGKLKLDLSGDELKVSSYNLLPVTSESPNRTVASLIKEAREDLHKQYGEKWLYEHVGDSYIDADNEHGQEIWSQFVADALRESSGADVAIHQPNVVGPNFPIGKIDREDLLNGHPRFFEFRDEKGWKVHKVKVRGFFIKSVFKVAMNFKLPLSFSGVSFKWRRLPWGGHIVRNVRINGKRINPFRSYTLAMPEGIVRGGLEVSKFTRWLLKKNEATPKLIIGAVEDKLRDEGKVDNNYLVDERRHSLKGLKGNPVTRERTYYPGVPR